MTPEERNNKIEENPLYPFTTPEGYFDDFKERLMNRIATKETTVATPQKTSVLRVLRPYIYAAAALAGIMLAINFAPDFFPTKATSDTTTSLANEKLSDEQFKQFLLDDTTEDYWGTVLLETFDDNRNISSWR